MPWICEYIYVFSLDKIQTELISLVKPPRARILKSDFAEKIILFACRMLRYFPKTVRFAFSLSDRALISICRLSLTCKIPLNYFANRWITWPILAMWSWYVFAKWWYPMQSKQTWNAAGFSVWHAETDWSLSQVPGCEPPSQFWPIRRQTSLWHINLSGLTLINLVHTYWVYLTKSDLFFFQSSRNKLSG